MQGRIVVMPDGRLGLFVDEGSFEEGKQAILRLLAELKAAGIEVEAVGEVERHRHTYETVAISEELHDHQH